MSARAKSRRTGHRDASLWPRFRQISACRTALSLPAVPLCPEPACTRLQWQP